MFVYNDNEMAENKKNENKFAKFLKAVFVKNWHVKLSAVAFGLLLWGLLIGLGFGTNNPFDYSNGFFEAIYNNIKAEFETLPNIIASAADLLLLIILIYLVFKFLHRYNASLLLRFIIPILLLAVVCTSKLLNLPVMEHVFSNILIILVISVLIMFPQELRRGIWKLASPNSAESFKTEYDCTEEELRAAVVDIVKAVLNMSKNNEGALIVIVTQAMPQHVIDSGTTVDAVLSQHLIECLFNTKANLHDGAVFVHGNRIVAAGCFLPLTQTADLPKELGTRHRAALGLTEQYPVLAIIVSEETGVISVSKGGQLERYYDGEMLTDIIQQEFGLKAVPGKKKRGRKSI